MNHLKKVVFIWGLYTLGYFTFWLYDICKGKILPTLICWLTLMIIAIVYDDGEIGIKGIGGGLIEMILAILALIFFPLVVFGGKLSQLAKKNKKILEVVFKKTTAGLILLMIFESFYWIIDCFWQLSPISILFFATMCFVGSGIVLFLYILTLAPIVANWFTQKLDETPSFWLRTSNQIVVALHIGFLLPICWLTDG